MTRKIRALLSRDDWYHQRGFWIIAKTLTDTGIEVVLGGIQTPMEIAQTALDEDVDIIGYRIMQAAPSIVVRSLFDEMKKRGIEDVPVVVGGIIPEKDEMVIKQMGVKAVFRSFDKLEMVQSRVKSIGEEALMKRDG